LYGWENATVDILLVDLTPDEADRLETHYIDILETLAPNGYNLKKGGDCHEWSDEAKEAQSERMKVVCDTPEFREAKSELMKKLREDPDFIEANILSLKKMWEDPNFKEAHIQKMTTIWGDEEWKKIQSDRLKKQWEDLVWRKIQCEIMSSSQKKRYEKEEEREKARKSHAHMRKFTDEELIEKNEEFKGSVEKLRKHFEISACVVSRHKKRLGLTRTRTKSHKS
jgi:hypothetical protein